MGGYGYDNVCEIFEDIGYRPPLMLLGSKEAAKIRNEVAKEKYHKAAQDLFSCIQADSDDIDLSDDERPFS